MIHNKIVSLLKYKDLLGIDPLWLCIEDRQLKDDLGERKRLRLQMTDHLKQLTEKGELTRIPSFDWSRLLDLTEIPETPFANISISHCQDSVGYALSAKEYQIGFDLENYDRVTKKTVLRVSTEAELALAPNPAALWVAKEASFKCLPVHVQPPIVSAIFIDCWEPTTTGLYKYQFHLTSPNHGEGSGIGICDVFDSLILGLSVGHP